ncbi:MAG TPA: lysylphosphatidylglycerol synthase transmembrane domain-containing protein [Acidimicrobiales bacterium]|nr:lysylphosphatidylglycerol synthase transmembrane domain-containing protein [Acidimicrobiales bacterium]
METAPAPIESEPADDQHAPTRRTWFRRGLALVLLGVAAYEAYQRHGEIAQAAHLVTHLRPGWLVLAILVQAASMVVFARLQRWLLRAGGVEIGLGEMTEITLAGNALGTSLPGGAAWAATWAFGQLRRRGADRVLAGWVILVAGALSSFALFVLVAAGAFIAGSTGPVAGLRWLAAVLAAIPVVAGAGLLASRRSPAVRRALARSWAVLNRRVPLTDRVGRVISHVVERLETVRPGALGWVEAFGLALTNWLYDAACLLACLEALHVRVPWRGLLVIYPLTQISASLPITPGGLGVVEGSMSALLVAYGVPMDQALATVLLYRIVSFWGLVPVGWSVWLWLEASSRHGRRTHHPWSIHLHARGDRPTRALGPERLLHTEPCDGCPEGADTGRRRRRAA